jgi:hypothetical protein
MIKKIHDIETGEIIERELNAEELKQHDLDKARVEAEIKAAATKSVDKTALLTKLGITESEAALLLS